MVPGVAIAIGAAAGLAGSLPGLLLCRAARRGRRPSVALGLGVTVWSFCLLSFAVGLGFQALGAQEFLGFALMLVGAFLGAWIAEAACAWRWINRRGPGSL